MKGHTIYYQFPDYYSLPDLIFEMLNCAAAYVPMLYSSEKLATYSATGWKV